MKELYSHICNLAGENCAQSAVKKFELYRYFLSEKNKLFNLTAITDPYEIEIKHFLDSLAAYPYIEGSVADIGSGAGFPAVPLKILMPDTEFTLIDSLNKRVNFLNELIALLCLEKITAVHSRAEDLPKSKKYGTVIARAVSRLNTLAEYCLPFVKEGGLFIAYKSEDCEEEINEAKYAVKKLGGSIEEVKAVDISTNLCRKLILIRKISATPDVYPRSGNKPRLKPLLG